MMINEFTERTGLEPTMDEYRVIEEMYYEFDGDKNAFCKDFMKKNGMIDVLRRLNAETAERFAKASERCSEAARKADELEIRAKKLEAALEKEQEWKPYEDKHNYPDGKYDELVRSGADELTDDEAAAKIADEFGFVREKIRIIRTVPTYEINRHNRLRKVGEKARRPVFAAWDWNYIRFDVAGNVTRSYEMTDGALSLFCD